MKKRVNHRPQVRYINPGSQRLKNKLPAIVDYESLLENNGSLPKKIFIWLVDKRSPKGNFVVFFLYRESFLPSQTKMATAKFGTLVNRHLVVGFNADIMG